MDLPDLGLAVIMNNRATEDPETRADENDLKSVLGTIGFTAWEFEDHNLEVMWQKSELRRYATISCRKTVLQYYSGICHHTIMLFD